MKPTHHEEPCIKCGATAQALKTDTAAVSWCENGHVMVDDYDRLPQSRLVYDYSTLIEEVTDAKA